MIELDHVSKRYRSLLRGRVVHALEDLTLTIPRGEVFGIAGPNGAGKSTLISLLMGFIAPSGGMVRVGGTAPRAYVEANGAAYLTELIAVPPRWRLEETLLRLAALEGVPGPRRRPRTAGVISLLGLGDHRAKQVRQLSKGTLQRLGIAQALLGERDLVILDEPTHGLDPLYTQRFREMLRELRRPDRVIIIASHNLDELERLTDRVAILNQGRLQRIVGAETRASDTGYAVYRLALAKPHAAMPAAFSDAEPVPGRPSEWRVRGDLGELNRQLARLLADGAAVTAFHPEESHLESEFRRAVGGET